MSRNIDTSKPLSAEDADYLIQRGRYAEVQAAGTLDDDQTSLEDAGGDLVGGAVNEARTGLDGGEGTGPALGQGATPPEGGDGDGQDLNDLTVPELQAILKSQDKPVSGTKDELIARINES